MDKILKVVLINGLLKICTLCTLKASFPALSVFIVSYGNLYQSYTRIAYPIEVQ